MSQMAQWSVYWLEVVLLQQQSPFYKCSTTVSQCLQAHCKKEKESIMFKEHNKSKQFITPQKQGPRSRFQESMSSQSPFSAHLKVAHPYLQLFAQGQQQLEPTCKTTWDRKKKAIYVNWFMKTVLKEKNINFFLFSFRA